VPQTLHAVKRRRNDGQTRQRLALPKHASDLETTPVVPFPEQEVVTTVWSSSTDASMRPRASAASRLPLGDRAGLDLALAMARDRNHVERGNYYSKIVLLFEERSLDNKRSFRNDPTASTHNPAEYRRWC